MGMRKMHLSKSAMEYAEKWVRGNENVGVTTEHPDWMYEMYDVGYGELMELIGPKMVVDRTHVCVFVGEKCANVPCDIACRVKKLINKFRLKVVNVDLVVPGFGDDDCRREFYELRIVVERKGVLSTRWFRNVYWKLYIKIFRKYGWCVVVRSEELGVRS